MSKTFFTKYEIANGPSVFMCGHAEYTLREEGKPGSVTFIARSSDDAERVVDFLNRKPKFTVNLTKSPYCPPSCPCQEL